MRNTVIIFITTLITSVILIVFGTNEINKTFPLDPKTLEIATPLGGGIDIEFLEENFGPAYEQ